MIAALAMCVTTGAADVSGVERSPAASVLVSQGSAKTSSSFSDEEIFRAVFFLNGPAASGLYRKSVFAEEPRFKEALTALQSPEAQSLIRTVLDEIEILNDDFLASWRKEVVSGDPFRVQEAIDAGNNVIDSLPVVQKEAAHLEQTYIPGETGIDCGLAVVVAAGFVLVVGAFAASAVVVLQAAAMGYHVAVAQNAVATRRSADDASGNLERDMWTALVAERLRG